MALSPDFASPRLRLVCDKNDKFVSDFISSGTFEEGEDINIIISFLSERLEDNLWFIHIIRRISSRTYNIKDKKRVFWSILCRVFKLVMVVS